MVDTDMAGMVDTAAAITLAGIMRTRMAAIIFIAATISGGTFTTGDSSASASTPKVTGAIG